MEIVLALLRLYAKEPALQLDFNTANNELIRLCGAEISLETTNHQYMASLEGYPIPKNLDEFIPCCVETVLQSQFCSVK